MNKGTNRNLTALALALLMGQAHAEYWDADELMKGFSQVSAQITQGDLQAAETGLEALRQNVSGLDVRVGQYQRELVSAYLQRGRQQLQAGDASAAAATLTQGQRHLQAASPSLKEQYQASLAAVSAGAGAELNAAASPAPATEQPQPQQVAAAPAAEPASPEGRRDEVERRLREAEATLARKEAEQARQQQLAAEQAAQREAEAQAKAEAKAAAAAEAARQVAAAQAKPEPVAAKVEAAKPVEVAKTAAPHARLIDPSAASSSVPLPMLDANDHTSLRSLLDRVAADVVAFDCAVRLQVRDAKDYPFVAALLSARIKKLDPGFAPQFSPVLKPDQEPRLVLSPQSNG